MAQNNISHNIFYALLAPTIFGYLGNYSLYKKALPLILPLLLEFWSFLDDDDGSKDELLSK